MENNNNDNIDVLNALINKVVNLENKLIGEIAEVKTILIKDTITKEMLDHDKKQLRNIDCLDQMSVSNPLKSSVTWDRWFLTD